MADTEYRYQNIDTFFADTDIFVSILSSPDTVRIDIFGSDTGIDICQ